MKSEELIKDQITALLQKIRNKAEVLTSNDLAQISGGLRQLEWVIDDNAWPKGNGHGELTLAKLPKVEQVIDAVHKE